jgi:hypothetical protein
MPFLRQSTATTLKLGPFLGPADGVSPFTAGGFTVKLGKAGGAMSPRHSATAIAHDADGFYAIVLDATDTDTVGRLLVEVPGSAGNYMAVWECHFVLPGPIYDVFLGGVPTIAGVAADIPSMIVQVWRALFRPVAKDKGTLTIKTLADDGSTVLTSQPYTDDGAGNETRGIAT